MKDVSGRYAIAQRYMLQHIGVDDDLACVSCLPQTNGRW